MSTVRRPAPAWLLAWALFLIAVLAPSLLGWLAPTWGSRVWVEHAITKSVLVMLAAAAMVSSGGGAREWGFRAPTQPRWRLVVLRGAGLGALASALILLTPAQGLRWIGDLGLPGQILWIWLYSSLTEEIFVRGWFQCFLAPSTDNAWTFGPFTAPGRVWISGLLFGSMHLTLLARGADTWTAVILVTTTTVLGLCAASDRHRTGSLGPPIATHMAFNVGGFLGAILTVGAIFAVTGRPPQL